MYFCILLSTTSVSKNSGWGMLLICIFAIELLGEREEGVGKTSLPPPLALCFFGSLPLLSARVFKKTRLQKKKTDIIFLRRDGLHERVRDPSDARDGLVERPTIDAFRRRRGTGSGELRRGGGLDGHGRERHGSADEFGGEPGAGGPHVFGDVDAQGKSTF